jgi:hypothetical protein
VQGKAVDLDKFLVLVQSLFSCMAHGQILVSKSPGYSLLKVV